MTPKSYIRINSWISLKDSHESSLGATAISVGYFDGNEPSRRIVEKLGFQKLGVAHNAAIRCLDGTKPDRHEYILTGLDVT